MEKQVRVVTYSRVAAYDKNDSHRLAMQKERLRQYAEQQGYTVVEEIAEVAKGNTLRRPGIRRVYQLSYNGAMDKILVETSSRIARSVNLLIKFHNKLEGYGVTAESRKEGPLNTLCRFLSFL